MDPSATWDWARQVANPDDRAAAFAGAAHELARQKPTLAFTFADELIDSTATEVISHAATLLAEKSPQQALDAAASLISAELQQHATASVAVAWSDVAPLAGAHIAGR